MTPTIRVSITRITPDGEIEIRRVVAVENPALQAPSIDGMVKRVMDHFYDCTEISEVGVQKVLG